MHPGEAESAAQAQPVSTSWWPLDCLRSLGRAASIASGQAGIQQHVDYRGFRILTSEQDGSYSARVTHWQGEPIRMIPRRDIDKARFASHDEAAQHARFLIASGSLNHLSTGT